MTVTIQASRHVLFQLGLHVMADHLAQLTFKIMQKVFDGCEFARYG